MKILLLFFLLASHTNLLPTPQISTLPNKPTFAQCMKIDPNFTKATIEGTIWQIIIRNYNQWREIKNISTTLKIPKIIHHIWVGPKQLSSECRSYIQSWKSKHQDWEFVLWTDKEIEELNLKNKKAYKNSNNYGEKSDIARYEILYRFGGLYVDTDFECLKSFDELHHSCDFYTGCSFGGENFGTFNGLIAARQEHPYIKKIIDEIYRKTEPVQSHGTTFGDILNRTGPGLFTQLLTDYLITTEDSQLLILPLTFLYPWPFWYRKQNNTLRRRWIKPESLAIHHWHISWNNGKLGN